MEEYLYGMASAGVVSAVPVQAAHPASPAAPRAGRKRNHSLDPVILEAALDVLAESGYDGTTIDLVAARAGAARATVYRRWATKVELVADALRRLAPDEVDLEHLPDTGTLRGDLLAASRPEDADESRRRVRVVSAVQIAANREPRLAAVLTESGTGPWIAANRVLIQRAVDRGEYGPADVEALAQVIPLMCTSRVAVQQLPVTPEYALALIDGVLLPALRGCATT